MRRLITCSFDDNGVIMTAWNGVHPDRPGHYSITKAISRFDFNEACKDKTLFGLILGVNIAEGWQNALKDAINNASNLKIDKEKSVDFLMQMLIKTHGEEKAKKIFAAAEKENKDIEAQIKELLEKQEPEEKKDPVKTTKPDLTDEEWKELESLFEELKVLDPKYERTGIETLDEVRDLVKKASNKKTKTEVKEKGEKDGKNNPGRNAKKSDQGSKKSGRKTTA